MLRRFVRVLFVVVILIQVPGHVAAERGDDSDVELDQQAAYRDFFYVGGEYVTGSTGESLMKNQMYVERLTTRRNPTQPYPLVLIHGKSMSGANTWLNTPDKRPGWADYFLRHGYVVYIVDQPTRGRSPWKPDDFTMQTFSAERIEQRFTAPKLYNLWPQSAAHTQWPGNGTKGDAHFDAFFASTLQFLSNDTEAQIRTRDAVVALLEIIGPAVLVTHSQSGSYGWLVADARPELVKAVVAMEPVGPPFQEAVFSNVSARAWGLTDVPVTYEPAATAPEEIATVRVSSNHDDNVDCILQAEPARSLPSLKSIPVLIGTGEASYHAMYDHCSVAFLRQAGVENVKLLPLESIGLRGNGHLMMLERNNLAIARALHLWIRENTK